MGAGVHELDHPQAPIALHPRGWALVMDTREESVQGRRDN